MKIIELTIIRANAKQKNCGSSIERIVLVIDQSRKNIKKMIRDDVISMLFGNIIHHIFPYNQKILFLIIYLIWYS